MNNAPLRKLIDLKQPVYYALSKEAAGKSISLKKHIESLLEDHTQVLLHQKKNYSPIVRRLIGSAKPANMDISSNEDERLQYLLSK